MSGLTRQVFILAFVILILFVGSTKGSGPRTSEEHRKSSGGQAPSTEQPVNRRMTKMTIAEARAKAPFPVLEPAYLPAGARYIEARYIEFEGQVFVVLQYEFEGKDVYFQIDEYSPSVTEMELTDAQRVSFGKYDGDAMFQHGFTVIRWTQGGTRLMLNGAIGQDEAKKVAASVR